MPHLKIVTTTVAVEKQLMLHILNVCLEPSVSSMQCACTILSFVACPTLQYFPTLSHKQHDFPKNITEYKICVLIFCTTCISDVPHSKKNWARYEQEDGQCTYNRTVRRVRATIVAVGKQWVLHNLRVCICSLRYPACNGHAPSHLWPTPLHNIFPRYLTNGTIFFKKKLL